MFKIVDNEDQFKQNSGVMCREDICQAEFIQFCPIFRVVNKSTLNCFENNLNSLSLNIIIFHHLIIRTKFDSL